MCRIFIKPTSSKFIHERRQNKEGKKWFCSLLLIVFTRVETSTHYMADRVQHIRYIEKYDEYNYGTEGNGGENDGAHLSSAYFPYARVWYYFVL